MKRIGFVGIGVMGRHMCGHLMDAGHEVAVFSRTASKCVPLVAKGARLAASPRDAASSADVVFTIVSQPVDVRSVVLDQETGILAGLRAGAVLVDMTTSTPSLAVEIHAEAQRRGVGVLDAPVSGGDVGAKAASLSIMCGGERATFDAVRPLLDVMGKNVRLMGGAGSGQHTKMANQVRMLLSLRLAGFGSPGSDAVRFAVPALVHLHPLPRPRLSDTRCAPQILACNNMIGVCEALLYAQTAGLEDLEGVIDALGSGAAGSWAMNNLGRKVVARDLAPGFMIEHMVKDLRIALAEASAMGLQLPGLELAERLYALLLERGHGKDGTQALVLALEQLAKERGGR
jgi:3-hydroxyisobutyrate dehydrogenase